MARHAAQLPLPSTNNQQLATNNSVVYHDPCYLGRYQSIYAEPRAVIEQQAALVEAPATTSAASAAEPAEDLPSSAKKKGTPESAMSAHANSQPPAPASSPPPARFVTPCSATRLPPSRPTAQPHPNSSTSPSSPPAAYLRLHPRKPDCPSKNSKAAPKDGFQHTTRPAQIKPTACASELRPTPAGRCQAAAAKKVPA